MYGENGLMKLALTRGPWSLSDLMIAWVYEIQIPDEAFVESGHTLPGDEYTDRFYEQFDDMPM